MSTQRINQIHQFGQGKLAIIQELAKNTLLEIRGNIIKCRKACSNDFLKMVVLARLLRNIKKVMNNQRK